MSKLRRECTVFCRYLIGTEPNDYIMKKYEEAHMSGAMSHAVRIAAFDRILVAMAGTSGVATTLVDSYAAVFFRTAVVRKKLVLLVAILESCAPSHSKFEIVDQVPKFLVCCNMLQRAICWVFLVFTGAVIFIPLRALISVAGRISQGTMALWQES